MRALIAAAICGLVTRGTSSPSAPASSSGCTGDPSWSGSRTSAAMPRRCVAKISS
jgi:hypothetical protein